MEAGTGEGMELYLEGALWNCQEWDYLLVYRIAENKIIVNYILQNLSLAGF